MDIHVTNVPLQSRNDELRAFLRPYLQEMGISVFDCQSPKNKPFAFLTVPDTFAGTKFVNRYGGPVRSRSSWTPRLKFHNHDLNFNRSRFEPDRFTLQALAEQARKVASKENAKPSQTRASRTHLVRTFHYGAWDYEKTRAVFMPAYSDGRVGSLVLGRHGLIVVLDATHTFPETHQVHVSYSSIEHVTLSTDPPSLSFAVKESPRIYKLVKQELSIEDRMKGLQINGAQGLDQRHDRHRVCSLQPDSGTVVGSCLSYWLGLFDKTSLNDIRRILSAQREVPDPITLATPAPRHINQYRGSLNVFQKTINDPSISHELSFEVRFQIERLVKNGILYPRLAVQILEKILSVREELELDDIRFAEGIRAFSFEVPYSGPQTDAATLNGTTLIASILRNSKALNKADSDYELLARNPHLALIHRAVVTPTGLYLEGPELETKNRVLRKYPDRSNDFLRVTFADEDYRQVCWEPGVLREDVFSRFRQIINSPIIVAGRSYVFLGFSHSSLRAFQCWFMAPFFSNGVVNAERVRKALGNFTVIRSPAKCAARIGQAFTDATDTIVLPRAQAVMGADDIEKNEFTFSDGVGTISMTLLRKVWKEFSRARKQKATLIQVRYQGAKGMLALDPTLKDEQAVFRKSMIKFEDSNDLNLEICGAAYKPLTMYLNRQFVKILEDLGVPGQAFMELQKLAVERISIMTSSPINAANFLQDQRLGQAIDLPGFIRVLSDIGLDYSLHDFLRLCIELAAMTQLRQLKYKARIPVQNAHTLFGVIDETGYLKEGEVYVCVRQNDGETCMLTGPAVITRAPALHPGDVQVVSAASVPEESPLRALHNCVVFSQNGTRDLPSQLSGGDLDGDLYNVIFDRSLHPSIIASPAKYPRMPPIDIGRPVEAADMTNFFLKFMETDQLGHLSTTHLQIADQKSDGTFDPLCIKLAAMASTAVDYSKTGIPVDMSEFPGPKLYARNAKPDFMATAPSLVLTENDKLHLEDIEDANLDDYSDAVSALEPDRKRTLFYESPKILGQLYRAIDERKFLTDIKSQTSARQLDGAQFLLGNAFMKKLWDFIQRETHLLQWHHHRDMALEIREYYENSLVDIAHNYRIDRSQPLSEIEVFTGIILGRKGGIPDKRVRETNIDMKESFEREIRYMVEWILYGHGDGGTVNHADNPLYYDGEASDEALGRSVACLAVAMEGRSKSYPKIGQLKSFEIVAASVCLKTLKRTRNGLRGRAV